MWNLIRIKPVKEVATDAVEGAFDTGFRNFHFVVIHGKPNDGYSRNFEAIMRHLESHISVPCHLKFNERFDDIDPNSLSFESHKLKDTWSAVKK